MKTTLVQSIALAVAATLLLAGCASPPKLSTITSVGNDDAAYLVYGALGRTEKQQEVAGRMAERAFGVLRADAPAAGSRNVHAWEAYIAALEKPIAVDTSAYQQAPELKPVADLKLIADYIAAQPSAMQLDGASLSPDWSSELSSARATATGLRKEVTAAVTEAQALAGSASWREAYTAILKAVEVAPRDKAVLKLAGEIQDKVMSDTVKDLDRVMKDVEELRAAFGSGDSTAEKVARVDGELGDAIARAMTIESMLASTTIAVSDRKAFEQLGSLRAAALGVRGAIWAEGIRIEAAGARYWNAYRASMDALARIEAQPALKETAARDEVVKAYADQLDDAVHHFLEKSNEAYYSDRFGTAFLVSRMCREVYDYALALGIGERPKALAEVQQADQTADDATKRIGSQFARRLLVTDFVPAVTEDYENIGYQIRTRCRYLTLPGNGLAWALDVPAPISLALESIGNITPLDLALSGVMDKKIQVDVLPPVELERGYMEVGTSLIRDVPNPMFNVLDDQPRTAYSQDVHLYPWIKSLHRKQARIAFRVVREVLNGPAITIYKVDETYPNEEMSFGKLAIEAENLTYQPMIMGTARLSTNKAELVADTPPVGRAPGLAPDDEIASAVINHVITGVMNAIEQEVSQFPAENLAAKAVALQSNKELEPAADAWGHFLVYIDNIAPKGGNGHASWLTRREELARFVANWNQTRWSKQPADVLEGVTNAWAHALDAYLGAP